MSVHARHKGGDGFTELTKASTTVVDLEAAFIWHWDREMPVRDLLVQRSWCERYHD